MTPTILGPVPVIVIFALDAATTLTLTRLLLKSMALLSCMLTCLYSAPNVRCPPVSGPTSTYTEFLETVMLKLGGISAPRRVYRLDPGKTTTPLVTLLGILAKLANR